MRSLAEGGSLGVAGSLTSFARGLLAEGSSLGAAGSLTSFARGLLAEGGSLGAAGSLTSFARDSLAPTVRPTSRSGSLANAMSGY